MPRSTRALQLLRSPGSREEMPEPDARRSLSIRPGGSSWDFLQSENKVRKLRKSLSGYKNPVKTAKSLLRQAKAVSEARLSEDVAWFAGVGLDLLANLVDEDV